MVKPHPYRTCRGSSEHIRSGRRKSTHVTQRPVRTSTPGLVKSDVITLSGSTVGVNICRRLLISHIKYPHVSQSRKIRVHELLSVQQGLPTSEWLTHYGSLNVFINLVLIKASDLSVCDEVRLSVALFVLDETLPYRWRRVTDDSQCSDRMLFTVEWWMIRSFIVVSDFSWVWPHADGSLSPALGNTRQIWTIGHLLRGFHNGITYF